MADLLNKRVEVIDRREHVDSKVPWWECAGDKAATTIFHFMKMWDTEQGGGRQLQNMQFYRMYSGRWLETMSISNFVLHQNFGAAANSFGNDLRRKPLTFNVVASVVNTLTSKLGKNQIKPTAMTSGSVYEQQHKTRMYNKAIHGILRDSMAYPRSVMTLKNALIFGNGETFVYADHVNKKLRCEAVFPDEIFVDPGAGYYGCPRQKYRRKFVSRRELMENFPDKADQLKKIAAINIGTNEIYSDLLLCVEAWHLKVGTSPGRRILCCDGVALEDIENWSGTRFPSAVLRYEEMPTGYWGVGVSERLEGIQLEINFTIGRIREQLRRLCKPWIFTEMGSKINPKSMDNEIGTIVPYIGTPPIIQMAQTVAPEQFRHLQDLVAKAYEEVGISQLSAQSQKPAGLDAAVALREYQDIETERFAELGRNYESYFVDLSNICADVIEREFGDDFIISATSRDNGLEMLRYGDVKLEKDSYQLQVFPQSSLPQKPEARLQRVTEMLTAGMIDIQTAIELLDYPDLESKMQLILAPARLVMRTLEKMIYESDKYIMPEPYMDLSIAVKLGTGLYNWCKLHDFDDEKLQMLRQWVDDCNALMAPPEEPPMPDVAPVQQTGMEAPGQTMGEAEMAMAAGQAGQMGIEPPMMPMEAPMDVPPEMQQPGAMPLV
jgi:hypothetical protein